MAKDLLVGSTGFVGGNLAAKHAFAAVCHSTDIAAQFGAKPDLCVYAGVPAAMFLANADPDADLAVMAAARENLRQIAPKQLVLISSIGGRTGRPGVGVNYAAAKAGVNGMAMCLGYELGPWNITVNSVAPGPLKGKMFLSLSQDKVDKLSAGVRIPRLGELDDIAAAIAYLGSDDASWTTGEVLDVNGGLQY